MIEVEQMGIERGGRRCRPLMPNLERDLMSFVFQEKMPQHANPRHDGQEAINLPPQEGGGPDSGVGRLG